MRYFILFLTVCCMAVPSTSLADATQPLVAQSTVDFDFNAADQYWGTGPCTGLYTLEFADFHGEKSAEATGIVVGIDGTVLPDGSIADDATWTLVSCVVTYDINTWNASDEMRRCIAIVHEVGHLDMHRHAEGGIMAPEIATEYLSQCDRRTNRQRAIDELVGKLRKPSGPAKYHYSLIWKCGPTRAQVFYCRISDTNRHQRRFKVRLYGAQGWSTREVAYRGPAI